MVGWLIQATKQEKKSTVHCSSTFFLIGRKGTLYIHVCKNKNINLHPFLSPLSSCSSLLAILRGAVSPSAGTCCSLVELHALQARLEHSAALPCSLRLSPAVAASETADASFWKGKWGFTGDEMNGFPVFIFQPAPALGWNMQEYIVELAWLWGAVREDEDMMVGSGFCSLF